MTFQIIKVVATTDMHITDKDLRHCPAAVGALDHLGFSVGVGPHIDLGKIDALLIQQSFGCVAKAAQRRRVDFNGFHRQHSFQRAVLKGI